jgi:hypothetical protein
MWHTQNNSLKDKVIQYQKYIIDIYVRTKIYSLLKWVCKIQKRNNYSSLKFEINK